MSVRWLGEEYMSRFLRGFNTATKTKEMKNLTLNFLKDIKKRRSFDIEKVLEDVIGKEAFSMVEILSLKDSILMLRIKNSTLYSIFSNYERDKILRKIQKKLSKDIIKNIIFKIG